MAHVVLTSLKLSVRESFVTAMCDFGVFPPTHVDTAFCLRAETIYTQKYIKTSANTKHDNCMAFGPKTLIMLFTVTKVCSMFARQSETENCVTIHSIRSEETRFNTMCTA